MLIFSTGAAASFLFTSCTNLFEENLPHTDNQTAEGESNQNGAETSEVTADGQLDGVNGTASSEASLQPITITGQICLTGAVPDFFSQSDATNPSDRSALPSYTASEIAYFAFATSGTNTVNASFGSGSSATTFTLTLIPNHDWTITCGIKKAGTATTAENFLLSTTSEPFNPTNLPTGQTLQFFPVPDTSTGTGQIDLSISLDSSISSVKLHCVGSNSASWPNPTNPSDFITISGSTATIKATTGSTIENVTSGLYEVMISFYDSSNALLYATVQNITVCKGMTTRVWVASGGDSPIDSGGNFTVTAAKIQGFASTNYFVAAAPLGEGDGFVAPADTNSGSHKAPFATLGRALTQIANYGNSTKDYKIHISGLQKVSDTATAGFEISGLDSNMNSLTLIGLTDNSTDILDGNDSFTTLIITSEKKVTVQNLKIQNGNAKNGDVKDNGGGVAKSGSGELLLDNCIVTGNKSVAAGGGFCGFVNSGDITIKNCTFESNTAGSNGGGIYSRDKLTIQNSIIKLNKAADAGGGIYNRDKDLTISGSSTLITLNQALSKSGGGIAVTEGANLIFSDATVSKNTAQKFGGGIYCSGSFSMTSGAIKENKTVSTDEDFTCGGGGIYIKNTLTMSGGIISGNESGSFGGGILLPNSSCKVILSGTAVIGDISKDTPAESDDDKHSNKAKKGGGIFNYAGKVYIGYTNETTPDPSFSGGVGYNYVTVHGGGIYSISTAIDAAEVYVNKAKIYANAAITYAGGIDIYNGSFEINNSEVKYNKADNGGGLGLGRQDGNPTCSIQNTIIQNNNAISNGAAIYLYGGNTTLIDVEITSNHAGSKAGGIFFNALGTKLLTLGTSTAESTVTIKNNTEGTSAPYSKSNVYLNATDYITIDGVLNTESEIGIKKASLPIANAFTAGFKLKNPSITPGDIFTSDENNYDVGANIVTGEAKLRISGSAGPALTWYYAAGDACMLLSAADIESLGLPEYHNSSSGTSFVLNRTSTGPFYDEETGDAAIFTGNIRIQNPASGTLVTAGTETSIGIPYTIAADTINSATCIYILLDIGTVYLDPVEGDDDNGGWNKDIPVKTVAQAKRILKNNAKTDPALIVMGSLNDKSEIEALSGLTRTSTGATSEYNGAIVKRHSSFTNAVLLSIPESLTLQNVTLDGGAVWSKTQTEIEADPELLVTRTNTGVSSSSYLVNASKAATFEDVIIQNVDNTSTSNSGNGAAVYISSTTLTLNNCLIKDCRSTHGAIFAAMNGKINATNTCFLCNNSIGSGSDKGHGGAVYLYSGSTSGGQATFDACSFNFNAANSFGGALYVSNNASATFKNQGTNSLANNFSNMATAAASRTCKGDFAYTRGKLTLLGDFAFGGGADALSFYIDNSSSSAATPSSQHPIYLGGSFGGLATTGTAKIYLAKNLEDSYGEAVLQQVASDTSVNLASAKVNFALENNTPSICEIDNNGKISPLPSGGTLYTALDYIFTLSADKTQVSRGEETVITITPTVKRKEADGSLTRLYYKPSEQMLYTDSVFGTLAGGNNTVTWAASLLCGGEAEDGLVVVPTSNQFTIPALAWEDNYTLCVTVTYMGVAHDTSFAVECVEHAFNATAYTDNGDGTVYFGDWPQSAKASGVTVNEAVSLEIGALTYYLGSDNKWYAKLDTDYYKVEPVKWKILTTDASGKKLLFADKALFGMPYVQINSYLNDEFINTVFTAAMQNTIDSTSYGKLFLLSKEEVTNPDYGFASSDGNSGSRVKQKTDYAAKLGVQQDGSGCWWIFRSESTQPYMPYSNGNGNASGGTRFWENNQCGTVPAMWVVGY